MSDAVKIKSSFYIIGRYKYQFASKTAKLLKDSLEFSIDLAHEKITISCSFKHIYQIKLFYDKEKQSAGLIVYLNELSAKRIQQEIDLNGNGFFNEKAKTPETQWFIIMDMINADTYQIASVKEMLLRCEEFHKKHVISQYMKRGNDPSTAKDLTTTFTIFIDQLTWQQALETAEKQARENHKPDTNGQISRNDVVAEPTVIYNIQSDGSVCQVLNRLSNGSLELKETTFSKSGNQQSSKFQDHVYAQSSSAYQSRQMMLVAPASPPQIREVHSQGYIHRPIKELSSVSINSSRGIRLAIVSSSGSLHNAILVENNNQMESRGLKRKHLIKNEIHTIDDEDLDQEACTSEKKPRENSLVFNYPSDGKDCIPLHYGDLHCLDEQIMINDTIIGFYLKYIFHELVPEERRKSIFMFNTFFYSKLTKTTGRVNVQQTTRLKRIEKNYQTLKTWTKHVNIFEKDYLVIPINEDIHWYLAIIANPSAGIQQLNSNENSRNSYIIIFDSLLEPERHKFIDETLGEYLRLEYMDKKETKNLPGVSFKRTCLKKILPKEIPQQKNEIDCGLFLLHYAELFLTNPPNLIEPTSSYKDWHPEFEIKQKRQAIQYLIRKLAKTAGSIVHFTDFLFDPSSEETKKDLNKWIQAEKAKSRTLKRRSSESNLLDIYHDSQSIPLKRSKSHNDLAALIELQQATGLVSI